MRCLILVFGFVSAFSYGQIALKEYAFCASKNGDLERLECYDLLAQQYEVDGPKVAVVSQPGSGKWNVTTDVNPVDDSKTVVAMLQADSGTSRFGAPVTLVVRCKSNKTNLFISWSSYLGREASVLSRVGNKAAVTRPWMLSTDSKSTFSKKPIPLLLEMLESPSFVAQITPYSASPITAVFDTTGMGDAMNEVRSTCNW